MDYEMRKLGKKVNKEEDKMREKVMIKNKKKKNTKLLRQDED